MAGLGRERQDRLRAGRRALALGAAAWLLVSGALPAAAQPDSGRGTIATVAGNGALATAGDGGPATPASLFDPAGLAIAPDGTVSIADTAAHRIRALSPDGTLRTVVGPAACPTLGGVGTCPYSESGDGGPARDATLRSPRGVAVDQAGRLLIADTENNRIRLVTPAS